ncbi:DUF2017 family protein [Schaalia naturae]|uniref:DUF2017 family protein n=1 Tax=Schaalia naturae TaxID=635203 RepID=A0ABW2SJM7_9ACTO
MIGGFEAWGDGYRAEVDAEDNRLLQQLVREILVLLDEPCDLTSFVRAATDLEDSRAEPRDPALTNLLPPMSDDPPEAAELRALTEDFLRSEKSARLRRLSLALQATEGANPGCVLVGRGEAWSWLAALNDLRLALAGELGIRSDSDAERVRETAQGLVSGDARRRVASVMYVAVTWWQDSLLRAVREGTRAH